MKTASTYFFLSAAWCLATVTPSDAQPTMVLRDLTLISDVSAESLEADGIRLPGGRLILWCDILQVDQAGQQQAEIDQRIANIGLPWFRIRQRMRLGDLGSLQPLADELRQRLDDRPSLASYAACAAQLHAAIRSGNRVKALEPLVQLQWMRPHLRHSLSTLDGETQLRFDELGICENLLPVWFEEDAAAVDDIALLFEKRPDLLTDPAQVYYAALLIVHGRLAEAKTTIDAITDSQYAIWKTVLSAQSVLFDNNVPVDAAAGRVDVPDTHAAGHAIALYYQGLLQLNATRRANEPSNELGAVTLLRIPAGYGERFPELSAAAVYHVRRSLDRASAGRESLAGELTGPYRDTFYGRRFRRESAPPPRR